MRHDTPEHLLETFFAAFNRHDLETLMALYEPQGTLVAQPGMVAQGAAAVREALGAFLAMKPAMTRERSQIVMAGDTALALTRWTLRGHRRGRLRRADARRCDRRAAPAGGWELARGARQSLGRVVALGVIHAGVITPA
jgi:uncharacterized protein (TIGR02246 family)